MTDQAFQTPETIAPENQTRRVRTPDLQALVSENGSQNRSYYTPVGAGWINSKGGFKLRLKAQSYTGEYLIMPVEEAHNTLSHEKREGNAPDYRVLMVETGKDNKNYFTRLGVGWSNSKGGVGLKLKAQTLNGEYLVMPIRTDQEEDEGQPIAEMYEGFEVDKDSGEIVDFEESAKT